jgi:hypothetical protein
MSPSRAALAVLIFGVLGVATLKPIWQEPGWPVSHEGYAFALRTHVYARHFAAMDILPLWSSLDASGFGSPMPLLYHKLFYVVAAPIALVAGSLKTAVLAAVALFLVAGSAGMYALLRSLGASVLAGIVAGCCLIAANYTVTNWLVRGALAEFSAAMVMPWVLLALARTIQAGRPTPGLGVSLGLVFLGHSVLGLYAVGLVALTCAVVAAIGLFPWTGLAPRAAWRALAWLAVLAGPVALVMVIVGRDYDVSRILAFPFHPIHQFKTLEAYIWESRWRFGRTVAGMSVQFDHAMLVMLAVGTAALFRPRGMHEEGTLRSVLEPITPFLVLAALGTLLQTPAAAAFYEAVPGAAFIQFPWRLLAIVTPSLIASAVFLVDRALPAGSRQFVLGAVTAWMIAACGSFVPLQDPRIALDPPPIDAVSFSGFREYEPRAAASVADLQRAIAARWAASGCTFERMDRDESLVVRFRTTCPRTTELPLPILGSPMHTVTTPAPGSPQACLDLPDLPGVCGAVIPAGDGQASVRLPTVGAFIRSTWNRLRLRM